MPPTTLPGSKTPYFIPSGTGERYLAGPVLATLLARPEDTGGLLEAAILSGGAEASFPLHQHQKAHESLYILDGQVELHLAGQCHLLNRGDYANIPPHAVHGFRMLSHYTRLLSWTINGDSTKLYATLGVPYPGFIIPEIKLPALSAQSMNAATAACDIHFTPQPDLPANPTFHPIETHVPPAGIHPYVLASDEGERLIAGDQLFSFLAHQGNTNGAFIILTTMGPKGDRIPDHFHEKHTETFFCLDGIMTMWAGGEELRLLPGDFLHVPPGTIHSYRLDAPFTRFVGLLAPGLFEPFFRTFCDPYEGYVFPQSPKPARFDRVIQKLAELDLKLVGPPR